MFRQLAVQIAATPAPTEAAANEVLTAYRPSQLSEYLEASWLLRRQGYVYQEPPPTSVPPGTLLPALEKSRPATNLLDVLPQVPPIGFSKTRPGAIWPHLIYAYMVESTNIVGIFRQVLTEWVNGGRLSIPSPETQRWIRATEALFFSSSFPFSVRAVTSQIRPDSEAVRRNAYYRLLGMDLTHRDRDGRPYSYVRPESANREFASTFESLLIEVWNAFANRTNSSGPNTTDEAGIAETLRRLTGMLQSQRRNGALSREEFDAVAFLSWLHLTVEFDSYVIQDLNAQAPSPAERLAKIGERVGIPAHSRSDSFFRIADPISVIVRDIENGVLTGNAGAQSLYLGLYSRPLMSVLTHWSTLTGRNIKTPAMTMAASTQLVARQGQQLRIGVPAPALTA